MRVLDSFIAPKSKRADKCEDGIAVTEHFAAVVDGATDKGNRKYGGLTPGRYAMQVCIEAIYSLDPYSDTKSAIRHLTGHLASKLPSDTPPDEGPTAAAAIYSAHRREIWQIGDVAFWHAGVSDDVGRPIKLIDRYAAEIRAAVLCAYLSNGENPEQLARSDPGRAAIHSILVGQSVFRNNPGANKWAYAALDGRPIDPDLVVVHPVPKEIDTIVLASDGYPSILPTLQASEQLLAKLLRQDPLCIGPLLGTKGVMAGNQSFDDRSYLRIAI
jgi:hypothetical protein